MKYPGDHKLGNSPDEVLNFIIEAVDAAEKSKHLHTREELIDTLGLIAICEQRILELGKTQNANRALRGVNTYRRMIRGLLRNQQ